MRDWMKQIPASELQLYKKAGFSGDLTPGQRMALIVVDVTMGFCGSQGLTLDEAVAQYSTACGPSAWAAMPRIARLIELFRKRELPIVYSLADPYSTEWTGKATKNVRRDRAKPVGYNDFPSEIAPREDEWVLAKTKASAFFQTPLTAYLTKTREGYALAAMKASFES